MFGLSHKFNYDLITRNIILLYYNYFIILFYHNHNKIPKLSWVADRTQIQDSQASTKNDFY